MKQLISLYILIACTTLSNGIIFSSDKHVGIIDTFLFKKDTLNCTQSISRYLTHYSNAESHFPQKEPMFITIKGALHPVNMPTNIKPFIVIFNDAQNIIDQHPDIFCLKNIKNNISFISKNKSNSAINAKLAELIVPIDHCTYIKKNKNSLDIVSIFFDMEILSLCIPRLQVTAKKRALDAIKKKRRRDFLSIPSNKSDPLELNYEKSEYDDQSIVRRANMAYYGAEDEEKDPDVVHVSVPDYDFWKSAASD